MINASTLLDSPILPQVVETERLVLRAPTEADAPWIYAYGRDPETTRYLRFTPHKDISDAQAFLAELIAHQAQTPQMRYGYALTLRDDPRPNHGIGMIEARRDFFTDHSVNIGYVLAPEHVGHGYMTEAAAALTELALSQPAIWRVWAVADIDNTPSHRTLERIGMQNEGTARRFIRHPNASPTPRDARLFAKVRP